MKHVWVGCLIVVVSLGLVSGCSQQATNSNSSTSDSDKSKDFASPLGRQAFVARVNSLDPNAKDYMSVSGDENEILHYYFRESTRSGIESFLDNITPQMKSIGFRRVVVHGKIDGKPVSWEREL